MAVRPSVSESMGAARTWHEVPSNHWCPLVHSVCAVAVPCMVDITTALTASSKDAGAIDTRIGMRAGMGRLGSERYWILNTIQALREGTCCTFANFTEKL